MPLFKNCSALESVLLPDSVISIKDSAFSNLVPLLKYIELPNNVNEICKETFTGCTALENVKMFNSINTIGESAFQGCRSLKVNSIT